MNITASDVWEIAKNVSGKFYAQLKYEFRTKHGKRRLFCN